MAITKVHTNIANINTSVAGFPESARAEHGDGFGDQVYGTNAGFGVIGADGTDYFEVLDALPEWYLRETDNVDRIASPVIVTGVPNNLHLNLDPTVADLQGHVWKDVRFNSGTRSTGLILNTLRAGMLRSNAVGDSDAVTIDVGDEITQVATGGALVSAQIIAVRTVATVIHVDIQLSTGGDLVDDTEFGLADGVLLNNADAAVTATFGQNIDTSGAVDVPVAVARRKITSVGADPTP